MSLPAKLRSKYFLTIIYCILSFSIVSANSKQASITALFLESEDGKEVPQSLAIENIYIRSHDGKMIRPLLGVDAGPSPVERDPGNPDLTEAYKKIGVNLVRNHDIYGALDMAIMYPDRMKDPANILSYNFRESDMRWKSIVEGGFEPYFRLGDSWNNARPPANQEELKNWVNASIEVLRHYRQGKWNGFSTQFRYVEIWNEPDNQQFWQKPHTPLEYFRLYDESSKAIKKYFPEVKVGGPGITQKAFEIPQGKKWLREYLRYLKQKNSPFDFFSWHIYSNDPQDWLKASRIYRNELDEMGYKEVAMHVTEYNTSTRFLENNLQELLALRTGGKGAAILTAAWIAMQKADIEEAIFYRGNDPAMDDVTFYGLFYANGNPKKVALAFRYGQNWLTTQ